MIMGVFDTNGVVPPGSAMDLLMKSASAGYLAAEVERRATDNRKSNVIDLDRHRRKSDMPSFRDACDLIESTFDQLSLVPTVREELGRGLGGVLFAVLDSENHALTTWRLLEREMRAPLRAADHGEWPLQPHTDRIFTIAALCLHYRTRHARSLEPARSRQ
jgi:hypothetical protein